MITFDLFKNILKAVRNAEEFCVTLDRAHIDIYETAVSHSFDTLLDELLKAYFTKEGVDTIMWWAYEHHNIALDFDENLDMLESGQLHMSDENDKRIPIDTVGELWSYVRNYRKHDDSNFEEVIGDASKTYARNATKDSDEARVIAIDYCEGARYAHNVLMGDE